MLAVREEVNRIVKQVKVKINQIKLSNEMKKVRKRKYNAYKEFMEEFGAEELQRFNPIAVNARMELTDGYATYCLLKEANIEEAHAIFDCETGYMKIVKGKHLVNNCPRRKEYAWKYELRAALTLNMKLWCEAGTTILPVLVTDIEIVDKNTIIHVHGKKLKKAIGIVKENTTIKNMTSP